MRVRGGCGVGEGVPNREATPEMGLRQREPGENLPSRTPLRICGGVGWVQGPIAPETRGVGGIWNRKLWEKAPPLPGDMGLLCRNVPECAGMGGYLMGPILKKRVGGYGGNGFPG